MSRKGKQPIAIPKGVEIKLVGNTVTVKGPKGNLSLDIMKGINVQVEDKQILVENDDAIHSKTNFHGLFRGLIDNMVHGVSVGFEKKLEMQGVGYRAAIKGNNLDIQVGLSHPMELPIPEGLQVKIDGKGTAIIITGSDKQKVGQYAAEIRAVKKPEPYQGKGIRYSGEHVRRKAGKAAAKK